MEGKFLMLKDIHEFVKALYAIDFINDDSMNMLINYLVDRGYDSEDYL